MCVGKATARTIYCTKKRDLIELLEQSCSSVHHHLNYTPRAESSALCSVFYSITKILCKKTKLKQKVFTRIHSEQNFDPTLWSCNLKSDRKFVK